MNINQEGKNYDFPETEGLQEVFSDISREFLDPVYSLEKLEEKYHTFYKTGFSGEEQMKMLLKSGSGIDDAGGTEMGDDRSADSPGNISK